MGKKYKHNKQSKQEQFHSNFQVAKKMKRKTHPVKQIEIYSLI